MRLLVVTLGVPHPRNGGAALRDGSLVRALAARHEVRVLALVDVAADLGALDAARAFVAPAEVEVRPLPPLRGRAVRALRPGEEAYAARVYRDVPAAARLRVLAAAFRPDVVQIEHAFLSGYRADALAGGPAATVLSLHNVTAIQYARIAELPAARAKRARARLNARLARGWEGAAAARFDAVVAVSETDASLLRAACPSLRVAVVENGVDLDARWPAAGGRALLFVATFGYEPNTDAARRLARGILPRVRDRVPGAELLLVGRAPPRRVRALGELPGVTVTGQVEELAPWYARAGVAVVPLRAGSGTRLKVLEAMAAGVPVVSTRLGCEGLAVEDGRHVLFAETDEELAEAAACVLRDASLRRRLIAEARALVGSRYGWDRQAGRLEALYAELVGAPPSRSTSSR